MLQSAWGRRNYPCCSEESVPDGHRRSLHPRPDRGLQDKHLRAGTPNFCAMASPPKNSVLYTASHSSTTPGGGELIRRQSAKLPHRNLTSPPSLWPGRELRKYHYPLCVSWLYPLQPDISDWFGIAHRLAFRNHPGWAGVSWRTIMQLENLSRTGTYLMNVYEIFKVQQAERESLLSNRLICSSHPIADGKSCFRTGSKRFFDFFFETCPTPVCCIFG